ncbi:magnesium-translocating P-type ATPase [Lactococcus termiticola]|uniref:Magnesium-transporting ATPase, P-type 1 n=1 Tax=Lactococcus termiticola TaxID=2169526 RepID=A0A2R5HJJ7_9LACT|nr:magnesium-translocating P-type ATPase [Lactococcus termiticola]GBG96451.1 magnesium-translocating P-type ATPase [Lactococcus termiticola]
MKKFNTRRKDELLIYAELRQEELFKSINTSPTGLTSPEAEERLETVGPNIVANQKLKPWYVLLAKAFWNPFALVLAFLALISALTGDAEGAIYMAAMIIISAAIAFYQEYKSERASDALREMIENTTQVLRDGSFIEIPMDEVVPGDIISLQTGDMIPADAILLESKDLFINQATLTGESYPVEKTFDDKQVTSSLDASNVLFMGTDVVSGNGKILIVKTGAQTMFGDLATKSSSSARIQSSFDKGLNRVSKLLISMVAILFPLVFLINWLTKGEPVDAFFFAIAVAVGLTPEMLPMIVNSNLAKGALALSKEKVIVKELSAIQNLGSMDILCTDKTGTITEDRVVMMTYLNIDGKKDDQVLEAAFINSNYQTGWKNLMDVAVITYFNQKERALKSGRLQKIDEIPFDFSRRRLSVVVENEKHEHIMVSKGAIEEMESICSHVMRNGEVLPLTDELRQQLQTISQEMSQEGMRVLTVAQKALTPDEVASFDKDSEQGLILMGFLGFLDPAKASAATAIKSLQGHGVTVKVLTGDNAIVAQKVCQDVGIDASHYYLGTDIDQMSDDELYLAASKTQLFAKLAPLQKARIIELLRKEHTVGFMGDGINDAPSLRAADIGISVDTAADITKEASNIILLEKSLQVLETGVIEGRKVFANMMKYIRITLSSNFGNVFSVLVASAFLPFLPMASVQLLTLNLIYDVSQLTVPWDTVDPEEIEQPVKWNTRGLAKFTLQIGPISSIFDITTFIVLWFAMGYTTMDQAPQFQAGWFILSLGTQSLAFHVLRTKKLPFVQSWAAWPVLISTFFAFVIGWTLLLTPIGQVLELPPVELPFVFWWIGIIVAYILLLQFMKKAYYKKESLY